MIKYYDIQEAAEILKISDKAIYKQIEENKIPNWRYKNNTIVGLDSDDHTENTRVISLINIKGGVAKTTSAVNISSFLSLLGFKVLLVDTDHQNQCMLFFNIKQPEYTIKDVLFSDIDIDKCIYKTDTYNLDLIPSDYRIAIMEKDLDDYYLLQNRLSPIRKKYDFIIFDNAPSLNVYNINSIMASTHVLIPALSDELSYQGVKHLFKSLEALIEGSDVKILGVFHTIFEKNLVISNDYRENFRKILGDYLLDTIIHKSVSLKELPVVKQNIFVYSNNRNRGYKDYKDLSLEILKKV